MGCALQLLGQSLRQVGSDLGRICGVGSSQKTDEVREIVGVLTLLVRQRSIHGAIITRRGDRTAPCSRSET